MSKEMVISANPHETRVAILEEGQLCEYYVERQKEFALVGSIYKGRVTRVLPGMQSAFVEIGLDSDAFLYVSDFLEGIEEFDSGVTTAVVDKPQKTEDEGGQVFPVENSAAPVAEPVGVEPAAEVLSPMPGESFGPASHAPSGQTPAASSAAHSSAPTHERSQGRPHFDNRGRQGRDMGRGGRRGRFDKRRGGGGGRGGPNRFGRELPSSKYASSSHHPIETNEQTHEPETPSDYTPIILPGETLAKYKEKPPASPTNLTATVDEPIAAAPMVAEEPVHEVPAAEAAAPVEHHTEHHIESHPEPRAEVHAPRSFSSSSSGLEPLPGETIAKWKRQDPEEPRHVDVAAAASAPQIPQGMEERSSLDIAQVHDEPLALAEADEVEEVDEVEEANGNVALDEPSRHEIELRQEEEDDEAEEVHDELIANEEHPATADLSEDEAASLAQQVAEAQIDAEARDARRREAGLDAAAETAEIAPLVADASDLETDEDEDEEDEIAAVGDKEFEAGEEADGEGHGELEETLHLLNEGELAEGVQPGADATAEASLTENGIQAAAEGQSQEQQPFKAQDEQ